MKSFSQFLDEMMIEKYDFVHEPTQSKARVFHSGPTRPATVTGVYTPHEHRGKGGAHAVMKQVTDHLDSHKKDAELYLQPNEAGWSTHKDKVEAREKLRKLYRVHGFIGSGKTMTRKHMGTETLSLSNKMRVVPMHGKEDE